MAPRDANCDNTMLFLGKHTAAIDLVCHRAGSTTADAGSAPAQVSKGAAKVRVGASPEAWLPVLLFYCFRGWHRSQYNTHRTQLHVTGFFVWEANFI